MMGEEPANRFDFRDMLGGASAIMSEPHEMPPGFMAACEVALVSIASAWKANPASVASGVVTAAICMAHRGIGIEQARSVGIHIQEVLDAVRETAEDCERDRVRRAL